MTRKYNRNGKSGRIYCIYNINYKPERKMKLNVSSRTIKERNVKYKKWFIG